MQIKLFQIIRILKHKGSTVLFHEESWAIEIFLEMRRQEGSRTSVIAIASYCLEGVKWLRYLFEEKKMPWCLSKPKSNSDLLLAETTSPSIWNSIVNAFFGVFCVLKGTETREQCSPKGGGVTWASTQGWGPRSKIQHYPAL